MRLFGKLAQALMNDPAIANFGKREMPAFCFGGNALKNCSFWKGTCANML